MQVMMSITMTKLNMRMMKADRRKQNLGVCHKQDDLLVIEMRMFSMRMMLLIMMKLNMMTMMMMKLNMMTMMKLGGSKTWVCVICKAGGWTAETYFHDNQLHQ